MYVRTLNIQCSPQGLSAYMYVVLPQCLQQPYFLALMWSQTPPKPHHAHPLGLKFILGQPCNVVRMYMHEQLWAPS